MSDTASALVSWNPNTEPDLQGYLFLWANVSGGPYRQIDVGLTATPVTPHYTLGPLFDRQTVYIVIKAYNTSNLISSASSEVSKFIPGSPLQATGQLVGVQIGGVVMGTVMKPNPVKFGT